MKDITCLISIPENKNKNMEEEIPAQIIVENFPDVLIDGNTQNQYTQQIPTGKTERNPHLILLTMEDYLILMSLNPQTNT